MNYKFFGALILSGVMGAFSSCDYQDRIDDLEVRVEALETAVEKLEKAYADGKIITDASAFIDGNGGYIITFSDGTNITLSNGAAGTDGVNGADGEAGVTPLLRIDAEGFWIVSYDGGETYARILDDEGNALPSAGRPGDTGADGAPGVAGEDGLCVRVTVSGGKYRFEVYSPSDPDRVIDSIDTPYSADAGSVVQSIVRDDATGVITLAMADGREFRFNLDVSYPTGIVLLTDRLVMADRREVAFEFRLNPSNAFMNMSVEGEAPALELDVVGKNGSRAGYVTSPAGYRLSRVEQCSAPDGTRLEGQYRAYVRDLGTEKMYDDRVTLVLNTRDAAGNAIQLSSAMMRVTCGLGNEILSFGVGDVKAVPIGGNVFEIRVTDIDNLEEVCPEIVTDAYRVSVAGKEYDPEAPLAVDLRRPVRLDVSSGRGESVSYTIVPYYSTLPVVYADTPAPIESKEEWVEECDLRLYHAGDRNADFAKVQMKGRGNSSWLYPKKSYAVKLDKKSEVLGMPRHKRWCLIANWMDRTLLRNDVAYEVGRRMTGLEWSPRGEFVDLVLNGRFIGNYYLCEQIKADENRVPVTEMESTDVDGEAITGGYILELDVAYDEVNKFKSAYRNLPVMIKEPDEDVLVDAQLEYIRNYVNTIESILFGSRKDEDISQWIDLESFADWYLVHELVINREPYWPKSVYMHKDRGGVMKAGPIWDFDWGSFVPGWDKWLNANNVWFGGLMKRKDFTDCLKERWLMHRDALATIPDYIDRRAAEIEDSWEPDSRLWPLTDTTNGDEQLSRTEALDRMKAAFTARFAWIDASLAAD